MFFLKSDGRAHLISPKRYYSIFATRPSSHVIIDVRTTEEFAESHIPNAVNLPVQGLANRLSEIPVGLPVIVYCRSGARSTVAARILSDAGYTQVYDLGGFIEWVTQGLPVECSANQ